MIVAHLADLHLGYRAYHRIGPGGVNVRERDVAQAFRAALDRLIELRPDLVLVAGDVFHAVRPPNAAIADAFRQFARLRASLPGAPVVVIAGNHDSPRSVETGSILRLLGEIPGVVVVENEARSVHLPELDASVFCVPHAAASAADERLALEPDAAAAHNFLMLHGTVTGGAAEGKLRFLGDYGAADVAADDLSPERWDYVALGHYHIRTELAPNMGYAGALERCTSNVWEEASSEKGFVTFDTTAGKSAFHPVPARPVTDLPRLSGRRPEALGDGASSFLSPEEMDAAILERVSSLEGGLDGRIVRLVLEECPRELFRELDHQRLREWRAEALHFHLDVRRPELRRDVGVGAPDRRRTLEEELEGFLERWQATSPGIETGRLVRLGLGYLSAAGPAEPAEADGAGGADGADGAGGADAAEEGGEP